MTDRTRETADDLFRGTPSYWSLHALKAVYCHISLAHPGRSIVAWHHCRRTLHERLPEASAS
jgi:hypothetical protein